MTRASKRHRSRPRLMFAASEHQADMLYAVGLFIPDPFLWAEIDGQRLIVVSALEYGRVAAQAPAGVDVLSMDMARQRFGFRKFKPVNLIAGLARYAGRKQWDVPADFPLSLARQLRRRQVTVYPMDKAFFPERACKDADEVEAVRAGVALAEAGLQVGLDILQKAKIKADQLYWNGQILTAGALRGEIDAEISRLGGLAAHTIVAPGRQGADPHNCGQGPLRPHESLVLDIFPRVLATGYHGDLTRTVVKGKAPEVVKRAYQAVQEAQAAAIEMIKPGIFGRTVHKKVRDILADHGFQTDAQADPPHGFFHGTGHGLGLQVHESPGIGNNKDRLRRGHVVTVEPGLYYPAWGGVRLEDVVWLVTRGCRSLTSAEKVLEIS